MRILICGSTRISESVAKHLLDAGRDIVGYVPSDRATFPGHMPVRMAQLDVPYDVLLSVQYDKKLPADPRHFNLHTGLLPEYGGCNVLSHTILNGEKEQGLTFHRIDEGFDSGEIISKISYPVLPTDTVSDLYVKMLALAGPFAELALDLVHWKGIQRPPTIYRRAELDPETSGRDVALIKAIL